MDDATRAARVKALLDLGLKFDGEQFYKDDINVHHTEIIIESELWDPLLADITKAIADRKAAGRKGY